MALSFSVAIVAYKRKDYLIRAVDSVLNQDYPRELIQIIVVKAFHDENIDSYLLGNGVKNIFLDTSINGDLISGALKECSNEVICLLEDDDIFYHSKLKTISDIYEKHPEIDFAVNGYNIIDRENNTVEKSSFRLAERVFQSNFPFTVDVIKNCNTSELNLIRVNFNASRYSLRKRVGEQLIESLMNIESNMDLMITLHCILSKLIIASIPANLNGYRIHENNVSLRTNILKLDIPFLINNRLKIKNSLNLFIAKNKIINHNFLSYAMLNCANLEFEYSMMMLDRSLIFKNFKLYLYKSKNVKFGGSFYGMFTHNKTRYVMKLLFLPLFIFFPRLARVLYVRIYA